jgi:hypothetical protein
MEVRTMTSLDSRTAGDSRVIMLGGSLSLDPTSKWFDFSQNMLNALSLLMEWVVARGGVRVSATDRRNLQITLVDDSSQCTNATFIATNMLTGRILGRPADFIFAPYGSALAECGALPARPPLLQPYSAAVPNAITPHAACGLWQLRRSRTQSERCF